VARTAETRCDRYASRFFLRANNSGGGCMARLISIAVVVGLVLSALVAGGLTCGS
jgi:hypothetical protein